MADTAPYDFTTVQVQRDNFEHLYNEVRDTEGRTLSDEQVSLLPDMDPLHPQYREWQFRKRSSQRWITYLANKHKSLNILEIGCGNGWLSHKMAQISNTRVTGLDINSDEIAQAKRVFKKENLHFIADNFTPGLFGAGKFDMILCAASVSYFPSLTNLIQQALSCLTVGGEFHIMDTHFYRTSEVTAAKKRMQDYYDAMGYPEMSAHYHHYTLADIAGFNYTILVNPRSLVNRLSKAEPFYWISIKS
jgi:2-polyprenyl-3-methyl-5-hydroxy-6-metoxy-1,4-benzoquinol methylase